MDRVTGGDGEPTPAFNTWAAAAFAPQGGRLDDPVRGDADKDTSALTECRATRGDDGPPYTCETCEKSFPTIAAYHGHQSAHAVDKADSDIDSTDGPASPSVASSIVTGGGPSNGGDES